MDGQSAAHTDQSGRAVLAGLAAGTHAVSLHLGEQECGSQSIQLDPEVNLLARLALQCAVFVIDSNVAGAEVWVDERRVATTSIPEARARIALPLGASHMLELRHTGFESRRVGVETTHAGETMLELRLLPVAPRTAIGWWVALALALAAATPLAVQVLRRRRQTTVRSASASNRTHRVLPHAFDRYRLEDLLAEGGMAQIFRGTDAVTGEVLAIKILAGQWAADPEIVFKFLAEAEALRRIKAAHPGARVPSASRSGREGNRADGHPFVAMEFVAGEPLHRLLADRGPLSPREAAWVTREIAETLIAVHDAGIVHRDITPENLLISPPRDLFSSGDSPSSWFGRAVTVLDFGIAAFPGIPEANLDLTATGKPPYMSPEQRGLRAVDGRSDIFSLGVLLLRMLTGTPPEATWTPGAETSSSVAAVPEGLPVDIDSLVREMLSPEPAGRPPSARSVVERIDLYLTKSGAEPLAIEGGVPAWRM